MDFLGVGPLELIVVLIIALIVVGPERLPQLAQSIGKTLGQLRAMSQGLTDEWQREMGSIPKVDAGTDLGKSLTQPLKEAQADLKQALIAPLTSPSDARARPAPPKATVQEEANPTSTEVSVGSAPSEATVLEQSDIPSIEARDEPASLEATSDEQLDTPSDDVNHVDT